MKKGIFDKHACEFKNEEDCVEELEEEGENLEKEEADYYEDAD